MGIRVGLVGCGRWGRFVLRDLVALGGEVTVAVRSADSRAAALEGGAASVVESADDLTGVEGIVVATPTQTHADVVERALEHGVPVFVEKPAHRRRRVGRATRAGRARSPVRDGQWRYHPGIEHLAAVARDGELGRVVGLRTHGSAGETPTTSTRPGSSCRTALDRPRDPRRAARAKERGRRHGRRNGRRPPSASSATIPGTR